MSLRGAFCAPIQSRGMRSGGIASQSMPTHNIIMRPPLAEDRNHVWPPWLANDECSFRVELEDSECRLGGAIPSKMPPIIWQAKPTPPHPGPLPGRERVCLCGENYSQGAAITSRGTPSSSHRARTCARATLGASAYAMTQCWVEPTRATWRAKRSMETSRRMTACG